jgi:hypothetical protein
VANLVTATSDDRETVATLTQAVATLTDQLAAKGIWANSQEAELKRLLGAQGNAAPVVPIVQSNAYTSEYIPLSQCFDSFESSFSFYKRKPKWRK